MVWRQICDSSFPEPIMTQFTDTETQCVVIKTFMCISCCVGETVLFMNMDKVKTGNSFFCAFCFFVFNRGYISYVAFIILIRVNIPKLNHSDDFILLWYSNLNTRNISTSMGTWRGGFSIHLGNCQCNVETSQDWRKHLSFTLKCQQEPFQFYTYMTIHVWRCKYHLPYIVGLEERMDCQHISNDWRSE